MAIAPRPSDKFPISVRRHRGMNATARVRSRIIHRYSGGQCKFLRCGLRHTSEDVGQAVRDVLDL